MCYAQIFLIGDDNIIEQYLLFGDDNGNPNEQKRREIAGAIMDTVQRSAGPISVYSIGHSHIADDRQCDCGQRNLELIAMYGTNGKGS